MFALGRWSGGGICLRMWSSQGRDSSPQRGLGCTEARDASAPWEPKSTAECSLDSACVLAKGEPGDDGKPGRQGIPGSPGEKVSETPVWEHPQPSAREGGILFSSLDFEAELAQEHRALLQNLLTCLICTPVACSHRVHLETKVSLDQQERLAMR